MDGALEKVCDTYIYNRDEMRRILGSHGIPMHLMGAAVLTALSHEPDEEKILAGEKLLKEREPEDSPIRGAIKSVTTVHMMLADSIEGYYRDLKRTHDLIHVSRGYEDERYYMAAMMMSNKISDMREILLLVDRTGAIHEGMGKSFLSVAEKSSYVTAAFAAACGVKNVRSYLDEVRACEAYLQNSGKTVNVTEDLCMLLALIPTELELKCDRAIGIFESFRAIGLNFERDEECSMVAFLSALEMPADEIVKAVYDADEFLKVQSGFIEGEGCVLRHVYAAMLVTMAYAPDRSTEVVRELIQNDVEALKRMVLMQSQSVMHIQMKYVDPEDLNI